MILFCEFTFFGESFHFLLLSVLITLWLCVGVCVCCFHSALLAFRFRPYVGVCVVRSYSIWILQTKWLSQQVIETNPCCQGFCTCPDQFQTIAYNRPQPQARRRAFPSSDTWLGAWMWPPTLHEEFLAFLSLQELNLLLVSGLGVQRLCITLFFLSLFLCIPLK